MATQPYVAEQRHQVRCPKALPAVVAMGTWPDYGFALRQTIDTQVKEAADFQAE